MLLKEVVEVSGGDVALGSSELVSERGGDEKQRARGEECEGREAVLEHLVLEDDEVDGRRFIGSDTKIVEDTLGAGVTIGE